MKWYKEFGYKNNPIETDPLETEQDPVGYDDEIEKLLYLVEAGNAVVIEGPKGSGKTMLLGQIINKFGGKGKIIYVNGKKVNKRMDFGLMLTEQQGGLAKMFGKKPKNMILLLDDATELPRKSYERLQYYFDQDYIKSVVFTTDDKSQLNLPGSMFDRIGQRIIHTKPLLMDDAVELVLDRLNEDIISKDKLEKIFILSDKNMTLFFKNLELVLTHMAENEEEEIDVKTISKIVGKTAEDAESEDESIVCHECGETLVKVGEHFRCKECDLYCPSCGVLISEDDLECPSCGVQFEFEEDE